MGGKYCKIATMRTRSLLRYLLPLLAAAIPLGSARAAKLTYRLYVFGVAVAEAAMTVDITPTGYRMALAYRTTGLGSLMSGDHLEENTGGAFAGDIPVPQEFLSNIRLKGHDRVTDMVYRAGLPSLAAIDPPNEAEREIVPPALTAHTIDPLSAIVAMLRRASHTGNCDLSLRTYDGRRLESFVARTGTEEELPTSVHTDYAGHGLRCDYASHVLAGFKNGDGRDEDARDRTGTFWLAPLIPGFPRLPVRAEVDTRFLGRAEMYLISVLP